MTSGVPLWEAMYYHNNEKKPQFIESLLHVPGTGLTAYMYYLNSMK